MSRNSAWKLLGLTPCRCRNRSASDSSGRSGSFRGRHGSAIRTADGRRRGVVIDDRLGAYNCDARRDHREPPGETSRVEDEDQRREHRERAGDEERSVEGIRGGADEDGLDSVEHRVEAGPVGR